MTDRQPDIDSLAADQAWFSRQYARLPGSEPDAALDATIRAAAHAGTGAARSARGYLPLALVASLAVVVGGALLFADLDNSPTGITTVQVPAAEDVAPEDAAPDDDTFELYVPCQRVRGAYLVPERRDPMVACPHEDYWIVSLRVAGNACRESQIPVRGDPEFDAEPGTDGIDVVVLNDSAGTRRLRCTAGGWQVIS